MVLPVRKSSFGGIPLIRQRERVGHVCHPDRSVRILPPVRLGGRVGGRAVGLSAEPILTSVDFNQRVLPTKGFSPHGGTAVRRVGRISSRELSPSRRTAGPSTPRPPTRNRCVWKERGRSGRDDTSLWSYGIGEQGPHRMHLCMSSRPRASAIYVCNPDQTRFSG